MILDLIEKDAKITQRTMSNAIGVAVSMINNYLDEYEQKGYITRKYNSTKNVEYFVSKKGIERRKLLNIWYLKASHMVLSSAKDNIIAFLDQIIHKGYKKILLYGAGEVAEIMLQVMNDDSMIPLEVLAVVDDDVTKIGKMIVNIPIISSKSINQYLCDGILISSYSQNEVIYKNLVSMHYNKKNIIQFFDV